MAVIAGWCCFPFLGRAYFPRTDPGQFIINVRMPSGTRLEVSNDYIAKVENIIRSVVKPKDLGMIVSNIGVYPDLSAIYTTNASMDTAFVQTSLKEDHSIGSYEYMREVQAQALAPDAGALHLFPGRRPGRWRDQPGTCRRPSTFRSNRTTWTSAYELAQQLAAKIQAIPNVSSVYIPQSIDYPGLALNIDRENASLIGLSAKDVVDDVITALTSDGMVAPSYWIDPKTGNNYMVTVQYANQLDRQHVDGGLGEYPAARVRARRLHPDEEGELADPASPPVSRRRSHRGLRAAGPGGRYSQINTPTEVDHYQIRRVIDIYVATKTEALQGVGASINRLLAETPHDRNTVIDMRGAVVSMNEAFHDFGFGLIIAVLLVYLILMAQFTLLHRSVHHSAGHSAGAGRSGSDPAHHRQHAEHHVADGRDHDGRHRGLEQHSDRRVRRHSAQAGQAAAGGDRESCRVRLRPILMTSLATLLGMIPLALGLEAGSEQYAPLARAIIGGLALSVVVTVFLVPAVYLLIHGRGERSAPAAEGLNMSKQCNNPHISAALALLSFAAALAALSQPLQAQSSRCQMRRPRISPLALAQDSASPVPAPASQSADAANAERTQRAPTQPAGSAAHPRASRADGDPQQSQHQRGAAAGARPGAGHARSALGRVAQATGDLTAVDAHDGQPHHRGLSEQPIRSTTARPADSR